MVIQQEQFTSLLYLNSLQNNMVLVVQDRYLFQGTFGMGILFTFPVKVKIFSQVVKVEPGL